MPLIPAKYYLFIFTCVCIHISAICCAQNSTAYNLNSRNGLPSDNVYAVITDRNGYLWACTDKGVVKYNGYQCRVFTTADGLPLNDVWSLVEDLRGRIWLGCVSGEMGYIYNDKYYKANLKNITGTFFPSTLRRCDSGIMLSSAHLNGTPRHTICFNGNRDTIYAIGPTDKRLKIPASLGKVYDVIIGTNGREILAQQDPFSNIVVTNIKNILDSPEKVHTIHVQYPKYKHTKQFYRNYVFLVINDAIITYKIDGASTSLMIRNLKKPLDDSVNIKDLGVNEPIEWAGYNHTIGREGIFYVFTRTKLLEFKVDTTVTFLKAYSIPYNTTGRKIKHTSYMDDGPWSGTVTTLTNGIYMEKRNEHFIKLPVDLDGYNSMGTISDSLSIWHNSGARKLVCVKDGRIIKEQEPIDGYDLSFLPLNTDSVMFYGSNCYYFGVKNGQLTSIPQLNAINYMAKSRAGMYYVASKTSAHVRSNDLDQSPILIADIDRYRGGTYDAVNDIFWAYTSTKVVRLSGTEKKLFTAQHILGNTTERIEKICLDYTYDNLVLKTSSKLYFIDRGTMKSINIPCNINLRDAFINTYKQVLIVHGNFGISFYKILGKGHLSQPVIYHNPREMYYNNALSVAFANNKVTMLTDNGTYEISLPGDDEYIRGNGVGQQFNIVVYCNNKIKKYTPTDVDTIDQNIRKFAVDVINPIGNGNIVYYYRFADTGLWQRSVTGDISIPQDFSPDNKYSVSVFVMDEAWKSNVFSIPIYIRPYWWQTKAMTRMIWIGGVLLAILFITVVILVTRRIVLRNAEKKNMQMELELKAIYAQINPHFIFNTLTSALLLISNNRMEEAYAHVSKFSKLLRSYLRSSRNKYVSIEEEVDNLKNYIELQQTRFKDRFISEIKVAEELNHIHAKIPSLLIQPFVENAINHGLLNHEKQGHLLIDFGYDRAENKIICTIADNGIGRQRSRESKKGVENTLGSYGNLMIKDLVNIFNRYETMQIHIDHVDKQAPETGTAVIITITNPQLA